MFSGYIWMLCVGVFAGECNCLSPMTQPPAALLPPGSDPKSACTRSNPKPKSREGK